MKLSDRAMLVYMSLRVWSAETLDVEASAKLENDNNAESGVIRAVKSLMPKEWLAPLATLKGTIRTQHYLLTLPWLDSGYRIITSALYPRYQQAMRDFGPLWDDCVNATLASYEDARERGMRAQGSLQSWDDYPTADKLRGRFTFSLRVRNMPDSDDFRVDMDADLLDAIRNQAIVDERETIRIANASATARMRGAVEHLRDRLKAYGETDGKGKKLYDSTVGNIRELVDILPSMDLTNDGKLSSLCGEISLSLCSYDVDTLKTSASLRDETVTKASEILDRMKDYGF